MRKGDLVFYSFEKARGGEGERRRPQKTRRFRVRNCLAQRDSRLVQNVGENNEARNFFERKRFFTMQISELLLSVYRDRFFFAEKFTNKISFEVRKFPEYLISLLILNNVDGTRNVATKP